jgi:hypothetical protein
MPVQKEDVRCGLTHGDGRRLACVPDTHTHFLGMRSS